MNGLWIEGSGRPPVLGNSLLGSVQSTADTVVGPEVSAGRGSTLRTNGCWVMSKRAHVAQERQKAVLFLKNSVRLVKIQCRTGAFINTHAASLSFSAALVPPGAVSFTPGRGCGLGDAGSPDVKA